MTQQSLDLKVEKKALVVLSGGQDSVTCLGWALENFREVEAIAFHYGQNHSIELEQAKKICEDRGINLMIAKTDILSTMADSALVTGGDVTVSHERKDNLPASFVPNRNAMFLNFAHAWAQKIGAVALVTGVCQTDYSGYPDCRENFIKAFEYALNIGYETNIAILTPLMFLTKAETFELAEQCHILDTVIEDSHTCYNGDREHKHDWGYGCGKCPACELRAKGWEEFKASKGE